MTWPQVRLKHVARVIAGQSPPSECVMDLDDQLPFIQGNAEFGALSPTPRYQCSSAPKRAQPADILLSVRAPVGAINVADQQLGIGRGVCAIRATPDTDSRYLRYSIVASVPALQAEATGSTYDAVTGEDVGNLALRAPERRVQVAVADHLDSETARIDTLIDRKQRFIDLLLEKRTALITHAVTKGVDPNAEMKRWPLLGEHYVPAHWELLRAKYVLRERDVRSVDGSEELLTVSHITGVTRRSEKQVYMFMAETNEGYKTCQQGDVAINTMWAYQGAAGVAPCEGIVSPSYNVYSFIREVEPRYYDMLLRSRPMIAEFDSRSTGIWKSRLRLYPSQFLDILVPVPPLDEQRAIVASVDAEVVEIDKLVNKCRSSIDLLREYRTALISAAVIGQIDIPGTEASEEVA